MIPVITNKLSAVYRANPSRPWGGATRLWAGGRFHRGFLFWRPMAAGCFLVVGIFAAGAVLGAEPGGRMAIRGMEYGKLVVAIRPDKSVTASGVDKKVQPLLEENLCLSGLFSIVNAVHEGCNKTRHFWERDIDDLRLIYSLETVAPPPSPDGSPSKAKPIQKLLFTLTDGEREDWVVYQARLNPMAPIGQAHMAYLVNSMAQALSGERGILGSTIAYSLHKTGYYKLVVATNTHGLGIMQISRNEEINVLTRRSPDGTALTYTVVTNKGSGVFYKPLEKEREAESRFITPPLGMNSGGSFSPDGKRLLIARASEGMTFLYEHVLASGQWRKVTSGNVIETSGVYSPDGTQMLYVSDETESPQIYRLEFATGKITEMTFHGEYNGDPAWRPDGGAMLYTTMENGIEKIYVMDFVAGSLHALETGRHDAEQPAWSPDGRQIAFVSKKSGEAKLYLISADGSNMHRLTDSPPGYEETNPAWTARQWLPLPEK